MHQNPVYGPPPGAPQEPDKDFFAGNQMPYYQNGQQSIPKESTIVTMGQVSIMGCAFGVAIGFIIGIVAVVMAAQGLKLYKDNPSLYRMDSYKKVRAALIKGIVAMSIFPVFIIVVVIIIATS